MFLTTLAHPRALAQTPRLNLFAPTPMNGARDSKRFLTAQPVLTGFFIIAQPWGFSPRRTVPTRHFRLMPIFHANIHVLAALQAQKRHENYSFAEVLVFNCKFSILNCQLYNYGRFSAGFVELIFFSDYKRAGVFG
jgi:hypothetical protein